jgi:hypothetical protein
MPRLGPPQSASIVGGSAGRLFESGPARSPLLLPGAETALPSLEQRK